MTISTYAIAPTRDGNRYQLRKVYRRIVGTVAQFERVEVLPETFPMNHKGREEARETVAILNRSAA